MTHYTVLIKFEGDLKDSYQILEKMLAPFNENTTIPRYKNYLDKDDIKRMAENYKIKETDTKKLLRKMRDWSGESGGVDSKGLFHWSTDNPQSKWDWYSIGGRWSGRFKLRDNPSLRTKRGIVGSPGVFKNQTGIDIAYAKDVDWDDMEKSSKKEANACWKKIEQAQKDPKMDKAKLWLDYDYEGESKADYIGKKCAWSTFAVLDDQGWHEPARMGWFACDFDRKESESEWTAKFKERFLSNFKRNTIVALIDCHI